MIRRSILAEQLDGGTRRGPRYERVIIFSARNLPNRYIVTRADVYSSYRGRILFVNDPKFGSWANDS